MEAVHGLYGGLGGGSVVVRDETETLGEVRLFVYEHFGRDHVAEREEGRRQICVCELLREMVNEQVAAFRAWNRKMLALVNCMMSELGEAILLLLVVQLKIKTQNLDRTVRCKDCRGSQSFVEKILFL